MTGLPPEPNRTAYGDESFLEAETGGYYVLATATFTASAVEQAREAMLNIRGTRRTDKLHWNEMDHRQRKSAAADVAALDGFHVVTVGSPVPERRQERARAMCLARLVTELHDYGVQTLYLEARTSELDARDVRTVIQARRSLAGLFVVEHLAGRDEPLLWVADIVAGAIRVDRHGDSTHRDILADCLYDIEVTTGC